MALFFGLASAGEECKQLLVWMAQHIRLLLRARDTVFPPLDKKNVCDKAKGLRVTSERCIVGLSVRCLSIINRAQDLRQQSSYSGCFYGLVERGVSFGREGNGW